MQKRLFLGSLVLATLCCVATSVLGTTAFDPFDYPVGNLIGTTNAQGIRWFQAGSDVGLTNQPVVEVGNLLETGLVASTGNYARFGSNGTSARFSFGNTIFGTNAGAGTIYYSLILRVNDITGLSAGGVFWAGFNNTVGSQTTTPSIVGTRIYTRAATNGFNLGLSKNSSTAGDIVWNTETNHTGDVIFIVGSYTFNATTASDDVSKMWINPSALDFGAAVEPAATLTASNGADMTSIQSYVLFNRIASEPLSINADELRVGDSWASVTPTTSEARPILTIARALPNVVITWPTNNSGFTLEALTNLSFTNAWMAVTNSVDTVDTNYSATIDASMGTSFFRLRK